MKDVQLGGVVFRSELPEDPSSFVRQRATDTSSGALQLMILLERQKCNIVHPLESINMGSFRKVRRWKRGRGKSEREVDRKRR